MTALKPTENRLVRAIASERYPLNKKCAHPECSEDAVDPHHAFPRSAIGGDSWFVELRFDVDKAKPFDESIAAVLGRTYRGIVIHQSDGSELLSVVLPHVTGLCRAHHDDAEEHRAWIKLEEGVWNWYRRMSSEETDAERERWSEETGEHQMSYPTDDDVWTLLGPLNPQPGSVESKTKRKKFQGEARRKRTTISIKVPQDEQEDGAGLLEDLQTKLEQALGNDPARPAYYVLVDALNFALNWVRDNDA